MTIAIALPEPDLDERLKALVHPVRRAILAKLKHPELHFAAQEHPLSLGVCASQIERICPLSQSSISAHLAVLLAAKLVSARRIGPYVFYKRNDDAVAALLEDLLRSLDSQPSPGKTDNADTP